MELSVSHQVYVFGCMILCGVLSGIVFDIFRSVRKCTKPRSCIIAAQDLFFWFIELCVVYITVFEVNNAQLRLYEAVALVLGAVFYFMTFSMYVVHFLCRVIMLFKKVLDFIFAPVRRGMEISAFYVKKLFGRLKSRIKHMNNGIFGSVKAKFGIAKALLCKKIKILSKKNKILEK